jgi:hypothetical protein
VATAALAACFGLAAPALAASPALAVPALAASANYPARGAPTGARAEASPVSRAQLPTHKSTRFAGYWSQMRLAGKVSVTAHIAVPKIKCTRANRAIAASVGMYASSEFSAASLIVGCFNGTRQYFPELVVNGSNRNYRTIQAYPGDKVVLHISESPTRTVASVIDKTQLIEERREGGGSATVSDPWVGDMGWSNRRSRLEGVPDFRTLRFFGASLNGAPVGYAPKLIRFNRYSSLGTGVIQIKTGPLSFYLDSFKTIFEHS